MSLAAALRASNPSQPNTVTQIRYSSRNSTARDDAMIAGIQRNTRPPQCPFRGELLGHAVAMVGSQGLPMRASWMASMERTPWLRALTR